MIPVTRTKLSFTADGSWHDVDLSAYVDAGLTAGIMLIVINTSVTEYGFGIRKNGSTDDFTSDVIEDTSHSWYATGIDGDNIVEVRADNSAVEFWLVAYMASSEATFFTNSISKDLSSSGVWEDIDVGAEAGSETPLVAFFALVGGGYNLYEWGLRKNGSTDDFTEDIYDGDTRGGFIGVDENGKCEGFADYHNYTHFELIGYLKANVSTLTNAVDYGASGAAAFEDVDFSDDLPAGSNGALCLFFPANGLELSFAVREKGASYDSYYDAVKQQHVWVEVDSNMEAEQKVQSTYLGLWLWGYTQAAAAENMVALQKGFISGYHCFVNQFVRSRVAGLDPYKLPDGSKF